jgi:arginine/lysine/ornithine decarboxylase
VQAAFLALAAQGEKVIVARNSHKSVIEAVILSGVEPVFADPLWDDQWEFTHPPTAATIADLLDRHPDTKAVFVVSPTDYGTVAELPDIVTACHKRDVPLIVDEAWGAHLAWHKVFPPSGVRAGADLTGHSVHKTGGGLLQASVLHIDGDLVDPVEVAQRMDLLATTSPATPVYASIDGWRRHMALDGKDVIKRTLREVAALRERVSRIPGLCVFGPDDVADMATGGLDPLKLTIDVAALGTTGFEFVEQLRQDHGVNLLLGNRRRATAILALGDTPERLSRLAAALEAVAAAPRHDPKREFGLAPLDCFLRDPEMLPREAYFSKTEQVPVDRAVGRICAELVSPYPPGVPVLFPGLRISREIVDYLHDGAHAGFLIPDAVDPQMDSLRVVA